MWTRLSLAEGAASLGVRRTFNDGNWRARAGSCVAGDDTSRRHAAGFYSIRGAAQAVPPEARAKPVLPDLKLSSKVGRIQASDKRMYAARPGR
jgi:hypothetical protein